MGRWRFARLVERNGSSGQTGLLRNSSGSSLVEFAFIGPIFIALLIAIFNTALVFLSQEGLETATEESARQLMTGTAQNASMTQAQFKTAACGYLPPFMSCSNLYADVTTASSYSAAVTSAPTFSYNTSGQLTNSFAYTPGTQGAIVVVRLMYLLPVQNGLLGFNLSTTMTNGPSRSRLLLATSVLKTEGYTAS